MKKIKIIQPGRFGDILLILPIAKFYFDQGCEIHWPICSQYYPLLQYVDYVKSYDIGDLSYWKECADRICTDAEILDLSIGFGKGDGWKQERLSFDQWKYKEADVPFNEKYNLSITRNIGREHELAKLLHIDPSLKYDVVHSAGSARRYHNFNLQHNFIEVIPIDDYTIFDWLFILENAQYIYCVDSCIGVLVDQMGIGLNKRYFHPWTEYYNKTDLSTLTPRISKDWEII